MLKAWDLVEGVDAHENIGFAIADLLDTVENLEDVGPIGSLAGSFADEYPGEEPPEALKRLGTKVTAERPGDSFHDLVLENYHSLREAETGDDVTIWGGKARNVVEFAEFFLGAITSERSHGGLGPLLVPFRHKFEAATGIDCSSFFLENRFRQVAAVGVLEKFWTKWTMRLSTSERDTSSAMSYLTEEIRVFRLFDGSCVGTNTPAWPGRGLW